MAPRFSASTMYLMVVAISLSPARRWTFTTSSPRTIDQVMPASRHDRKRRRSSAALRTVRRGRSHPGELEVLAHDDGELVVVRARERWDDEIGALAAVAHSLQKWEKVRLDRDLAALVRLGALELFVLVVPRLGDADLLVVEVDVVPRECLQLARPGVRVRRDRVELAPREGHVVAGHQREQFRRMWVALQLVATTLGRLDAARGVG